ncbi:hypothetical protein YPPY94_4004 [Yersinia pestis PY-94]|uniref:Uncharacterized protein n=2 Tax=Yersinia pestis TaxID=632 RepID=Q8CLP6_YERPE|nr:hypothetical [Yersinia pestis KIM10+]EDR67570.1 conserved hypothetical protein [Yersinia pestis biovar Mediaevalis str. K1973002]EIR14185.1 hypothetical protein YPPY08_4008 [Yersinia pestis PY-08]EIR43701.1 hypothetical protein YPPY15_3946 [Yersinia pestis PY-15]EIR61230.1 hypothetical protein YPPY25_4003 [Yersinia pestis PY-25]EIS01191.1 hypothetical protein YPPY48_4030 [Yersinia pestis PY-48]EIS15140.1 hypothetical protein YPPY53_4040 [Yersinia pestis PY-53]EIT11630.1 hypothetical prote
MNTKQAKIILLCIKFYRTFIVLIVIVRNCTDIDCLIFSALRKDSEKKYFSPNKLKKSQ